MKEPKFSVGETVRVGGITSPVMMITNVSKQPGVGESGETDWVVRLMWFNTRYEVQVQNMPEMFLDIANSGE